MPIPNLRSIEPEQDHRAAQKLILPAIPLDPATLRESTAPGERLPIRPLQSPPQSKNPQALEAEIVRLGNNRKAPEVVAVPVTVSPRLLQSEKIAPTGYRPLHMIYQTSNHAVIDGHHYQKKGGFSFYFSWHDILLFCLVGLVAAAIVGSVVLIFL